MDSSPCRALLHNYCGQVVLTHVFVRHQAACFGTSVKTGKITAGDGWKRCAVTSITLCKLLPSRAKTMKWMLVLHPYHSVWEGNAASQLLSPFDITFFELVIFKFDICMRGLDDTSFACRMMMIAEWSGGSRERQCCYEVTCRRSGTSYRDTECDLAV